MIMIIHILASVWLLYRRFKCKYEIRAVFLGIFLINVGKAFPNFPNFSQKV